MKPVDVNSSAYIDFNKENYQKGPKFEVGDHVKILKYENIIAKGNIRNCSEEFFAIKKIKNTVPSTYVISDLNCDKILGTFHRNELQKNKTKRGQG